jgi:hypothetical protein
MTETPESLEPLPEDSTEEPFFLRLPSGLNTPSFYRSVLRRAVLREILY